MAYHQYSFTFTYYVTQHLYLQHLNASMESFRYISSNHCCMYAKFDCVFPMQWTVREILE
jgi:hypothetical protein